MADQSSTNPLSNPWVVGALFAALLTLTLLLMAVAAPFLGDGVARVLVLVIWAVLLVACGAVAARYGASGAMAGGIAGGILTILVVILQLLRVAVGLMRLFYTDIDFTGARLYTLLWTLGLLVVAVAAGALLGWIGAKLSPSRTT